MWDNRRHEMVHHLGNRSRTDPRRVGGGVVGGSHDAPGGSAVRNPHRSSSTDTGHSAHRAGWLAPRSRVAEGTLELVVLWFHPLPGDLPDDADHAGASQKRARWS